MAMADWSTLLAELLNIISQHLQTSIDFLRFRSVCPEWRNAVPAPPATSARLPILPPSDTCSSRGFFLSKRTIYSLESPRGDNSSWIIKLEQDNPLSMHLLHPLGWLAFTPLPANFPKLFSFLNIRVKELGEEYVLQYINLRTNANSMIGESGNLYLEKVAVKNLLNGAFMLLTIHVSGNLAVYKSGDSKWNIIDDFPSSPYDDVILRQGKFYAVEHTGRVVVVDGENLNVRVVADSFVGGDKKLLVDSEGELLLVDMYLSVGRAYDLGFGDCFEFYEEFDCFTSERTVKFKVYRLDETCGEWVKMSDLGDQILFLGDNCTFSVRASEISCDGSYHRNCIFFMDQYSRNREEEEGVLIRRGVGVFDMVTGTIKPMGEIAGAIKMFWPPPEWVESAAKS